MMGAQDSMDYIGQFTDAVFRHVDGGEVWLKSFIEGSSEVFEQKCIKLRDPRSLNTAAAEMAECARTNAKPVVFAPIWSAFKDNSSAAESNLAAVPVIALELDYNAATALNSSRIGNIDNCYTKYGSPQDFVIGILKQRGLL